MDRCIMKEHILRHRWIYALSVVIAVGAFLRLYHFEDWMHYQLDQARDFRVVYAAMEYGPGELPLQGPRAAGSFLRLGPWLYYVEYVSALIFGNTPAGSVMIIALLNIAAIGLFFALSRRFFGPRLSLGLSTIFAMSLFLISYSRFGWNPNLLTPFTLLFIYALLRTSDTEDARRGWWLIVAAAALAFLMSMHFVAFVTMPLVAVLYLMWTRTRINWRYWVGAIGVFVILNTPLIVNDIKTGGDNAQAFMQTLLARAGVDDSDEEGEEKDTAKHTVIEKIVTNTGLHVQYYWMIATGDQLAGMPTLSGMDIRCDYDCRHGFGRGMIALGCLVAALSALWQFYRYTSLNQERDFLRMIVLWAGVVFLFFTPLAYDIAPRFFLLVAPVAILVVGFVVSGVRLWLPRGGYTLGVAIVLLCIACNMFFVLRYFGELRAAATDPTAEIMHRDRVLKERVRVTFGQMMAIVDWIEEIHMSNGEAVFVHAQPEYKRALWERIDVRGIPRDPIALDLSPLYRKGNYFVVVRAQSDQEAFLAKFMPGLDIVERKAFGTLTAYYLRAKPEAVTEEEKIFAPSQRDPVFASGVQIRYLWRQVWTEE